MKPHLFSEEADGTCELCGLAADHPIHELDGVALGDAEDDFTPPDEPDSGFDVREPETVTDLFRGYNGRYLP